MQVLKATSGVLWGVVDGSTVVAALFLRSVLAVAAWQHVPRGSRHESGCLLATNNLSVRRG